LSRLLIPALPANGPYRLLNARVPTAMVALTGGITAKADFEGLVAVDIDVDHRGNVGLVRPASMNGIEVAGAGPAIDLDNRVVFTRLAEIHTHIDKTQTWERAPNFDGSYQGAKLGAKGDRREPWSYEDAYRRMSFALNCAYAYGTRSLRTHIDSQKKRTSPSWKVFDDLRREWSERIALQGVVSLGAGKIMGKYGDRVAQTAADYGAAFGPVIYPTENQQAEIIRSFELAERYGLSLDFHVDETLDATANGLELIARTALDRGFKNNIVCGHVCSLSMKDDEEISGILSIVREAGIGIATLPMTNLYLQDRDEEISSIPTAPLFRGAAPMRNIYAADVMLAAGGDNCRDAFHPYGDFDQVEVYREAVRIGHLDNPTGQYANCIASVAETMMGLEEPILIAQGRVADMIIFSGRSFSQVFSRLGAPRKVICRGTPVNAELPDFENFSQTW